MTNLHQTDALPWVSRHIVRAGGLFGVGFGEASDLLLVATHDGRGVVDCATGELLAHDHDPLFLFDEDRRAAQGIGPLADQEISLAGPIYGGTLPTQTQDGWRLSGSLTNSSDDVVTLLPPVDDAGEPSLFTGFIPEVRVFGFSPTGRSFVIGTGADVYTFAR